MRAGRRSNSPIPLRVRAEAAAWLAMLRGPSRTEMQLQCFREWLAKDPQHRAVWETMSEGWELAGALRPDMRQLAAAVEKGRSRLALFAACAPVAILIILSGFLLYYLNDDSLQTGVGETRLVTLEDGTRVTLNTETRAIVRYGSRARRVILQHGEAQFDVAKKSTWPFIVMAGGKEIHALGTSFLVRKDDVTGLSVTLVEGKVSVGNTLDDTDARQPLQVLEPGQRLRVSQSGISTLDHPELTRVTAWQHGEVTFDETPLSEAIAEMNRYAVTPIVVESTAARNHRISGLFRAGDSEDFARGIAETYGLAMSTRDGQIVLADPRP